MISYLAHWANAAFPVEIKKKKIRLKHLQRSKFKYKNSKTQKYGSFPTNIKSKRVVESLMFSSSDVSNFMRFSFFFSFSSPLNLSKRAIFRNSHAITQGREEAKNPRWKFDFLPFYQQPSQSIRNETEIKIGIWMRKWMRTLMILRGRLLLAIVELDWKACNRVSKERKREFLSLA